MMNAIFWKARLACKGCMWFISFSVQFWCLGSPQQDMSLVLLRSQALIHSRCSLNLIPCQVLLQSHGSPAPRPRRRAACAWLGQCPTGMCQGDVLRALLPMLPTASFLSLWCLVAPTVRPGPGTTQAGTHAVSPTSFPFLLADFSRFKLLLSHFSYPAVEVLLCRSELMNWS